jgi:hypothetical protein
MLLLNKLKTQIMKKFNEVISVEVSVDAIAEQLLGHIDPQFKHREDVVESIIGPLLDKNTLSYLYNALNGYTNDINFEVGDEVMCEEKIYTFTRDANGEVSKEAKYIKLGRATIVGIEPFRKKNLELEYMVLSKNNELRKQTDYFSHLTCAHIPLK